MNFRKCSVCKEELELSSDNFHKNKREIGGFDYRCKKCKLIHYNLNKDKYKENSINWQQNNKNKVKAISEKYRKSEKGISKRKEYRKEEYNKKYGIDIEWTLIRNLRIRLYHSLKKNIKTGTTLELLGCSIEEYKQYLESLFAPEMNWDNYGKYWEVDHIIPLSKGGNFHYTNTQPLTVSENRKKKNKLI